MKGFLFFAYPDLFTTVSSLSTRREGEEGEFFTKYREQIDY